ncbi:RNA polymerase sigma factor [Fibrella forsythiae]|uniref:RNA polymerase sigma factor n=1 Tax=Fibrella forsythiae TaxID=2817061 RepID=A0ABS3JQ15_9BACT|nr:RNA polymerase sigma factor [Fibrella forsythiae]MBO0951568.1 RNA polymerase sigma factor [Fibrella forsythiae]
MSPSPQAEEHLIASLLADHPAAFATLYTTYAPGLLRLLVRMLHDRGRAEDLLQDAFLKIWLNRQAYDAQQGKLLTWMLTIARNLALDELKHQKRLQTAAPYLTDEPCFSTTSEGPLHYSVTAHLAPKYQEIIDLVYNQAYTREEVAQALGLPLGTVKTRYRFALQQLRCILYQDIHHYHKRASTGAGCGQRDIDFNS